MPPKKREPEYPASVKEALERLDGSDAVQQLGRFTTELTSLQAEIAELRVKEEATTKARGEAKQEINKATHHMLDVLYQSYQAGELSQEALQAAVARFFPDFSPRIDNFERIKPGKEVIVSSCNMEPIHVGGVVESLELGLTLEEYSSEYSDGQPITTINPCYVLKVTEPNGLAGEGDGSIHEFVIRPDYIDIDIYTKVGQVVDLLQWYAGGDINQVLHYYSLRDAAINTFPGIKFKKFYSEMAANNLEGRVMSSTRMYDNIPDERVFSDYDTGARAIRVLRKHFPDLYHELEEGVLSAAVDDSLGGNKRYEIISSFAGSVILAENPDIADDDLRIAQAVKFADYINRGVERAKAEAQE